MGYGHSLDLRSRIIAAVRSGSSARAAARRFGVSASSAINLVSRWRETGSYAPGQVGGQKRRKLAGHEDWLREMMASEPDITLSELRDLAAARGITISRESINDTLHALGYRYKKNRARGGARTRRRGGQAPSMAQLAALAETGTAGLYR
jgi:putative transposase